MLILAIETTDKAGSVALLDGARLLGNLELDPAQRSAQSLAPGIDEILKAENRQPQDIKLVAVANGPGSFTGLRVGVTTAKMFAYAVGASVLGVNALETIAQQSDASTPQLWAVMDAQRDEVFAARFARDTCGKWILQGETQLLPSGEWIQSLTTETAISGPILMKLGNRIPADIPRVDSSTWNPLATTIGQIAFERYSAGARDDIFQLVPEYFRRSAAEEKRLQQSGQ